MVVLVLVIFGGSVVLAKHLLTLDKILSEINETLKDLRKILRKR